MLINTATHPWQLQVYYINQEKSALLNYICWIWISLQLPKYTSFLSSQVKFHLFSQAHQTECFLDPLDVSHVFIW